MKFMANSQFFLANPKLLTKLFTFSKISTRKKRNEKETYRTKEKRKAATQQQQQSREENELNE